ncbi:MAG TPA: hypothetical protein EYH34_15315 [Planctomycetes bacterium]|nr:hypothetical protein [Planctomycetota bacterium]
MQRRRLGRLAGIGLLLWLTSGGLAAQQGDPSAPPASEEGGQGEAQAPAGPVVEVKPDIFLLPDEEGNWRQLLGMRYEQLRRAWEIAEGREDPPPRYTVRSVLLKGLVRKGRAELTIEIVVRLHRPTWTRVPLRLGQALLRGPIGHHGEATYRWRFEEGEGYVLWVRGAAESDQTFTLDALVPVSEAAGRYRLALSVPSAEDCRLTLRVPLAGATGRVSERGEVVSAAPAPDGGTQFELRGLGGSFEVQWWRVDTGSQPAQPVLEASGLITVTLDRQTVTATAQLTVHSRSGPVDRFQVRLPEGAEWWPQQTTGYHVAPQPRSDDQPQVVEVRFDGQHAEPVTVELAARRSLEDDQPDAWLELGGFEVLGAVQQQGHVAVGKPEDQYLVWGPNRGVRPVPVSQLPEALRGEQVVAGFEYRSQPWSLRTRLVDRQTRVEVEPIYMVEIEKGVARLEATFRYVIHGGEVLSFDFEVAGWQLDEVEPDSFLPTESEGASGPEGTRRVTVTRSELESSVRQLELVLHGHRALDPAAESLRLVFPRPVPSRTDRASLKVRPGWVVIVSADNVELSPDEEATVGLSLRPLPAPVPVPSRQQPPLVYRLEDPEAVFAAARAVHQQVLGVEVDSRIYLIPDEERVEETLVWRVEYEPADRLRLSVSGQLDLGSLELWLDDEPVRLSDLTANGQQVAEDGSVLKEVRLPKPGMGTYRLRVRFPLSVTLQQWEPGSALPCTVPLVMPRDGQLVRNRATLITRPGIRPVLRDAAWELEENGSPAPVGLASWTLRATQPASAIRVGLVLEDRAALGLTRISRGWVQTWIHPAASQEQAYVRRDRAVFRFVTDRRLLPVRLPPGTRAAEVAIWLDNQPVTPLRGPEDRLHIVLGEPDGAEHSLELQYSLPVQRAGSMEWAFQLPQIGEQPWVERCYWELILPGNEHVVAVPEWLTREYRWGWTGLFWGRIPVMDQVQLEDWAGTVHRARPAGRTSRYLFSSPEAMGVCRLVALRRSWIVLAGSGMALVFGLFLLYLPAGRRVVVLWVGVVVFVAATLLWPGPALLLGQASGLGVVLALLAAVLERTLGRRRQTRWWPETSSSVLERGSTQILQPLPSEGLSTRTLPAATPESSV